METSSHPSALEAQGTDLPSQVAADEGRKLVCGITVEEYAGFVKLTVRGAPTRDEFIRLARRHPFSVEAHRFVWDLRKADIGRLCQNGFRCMAALIQILFARGQDHQAAFLVAAGDPFVALSSEFSSGTPAGVTTHLFDSKKRINDWLRQNVVAVPTRGGRSLSCSGRNLKKKLARPGV